MLKSFYDDVNLQWDEVCDPIRPELKHELDVGDGTGGSWIIL